MFKSCTNALDGQTNDCASHEVTGTSQENVPKAKDRKLMTSSGQDKKGDNKKQITEEV